MARLSDDEARRRLEGCPGSEVAGSAIRPVYTSGGLTGRDLRLAGRIDA